MRKSFLIILIILFVSTLCFAEKPIDSTDSLCPVVFYESIEGGETTKSKLTIEKVGAVKQIEDFINQSINRENENNYVRVTHVWLTIYVEQKVISALIALYNHDQALGENWPKCKPNYGYGVEIYDPKGEKSIPDLLSNWEYWIPVFTYDKDQVEQLLKSLNS